MIAKQDFDRSAVILTALCVTHHNIPMLVKEPSR